MFTMFKGWRTIMFNLLLILISVIAFIEQNSEIVTMVFNDPNKAKLVLAGVGAIGIILRTLTSTSVLSADEDNL